ncbi:MAG: PAS domain S-box protein, partial [Methanomicrobiales archaeon]|nr:PAS domain S-box protein [Methanomicrobiales archaeon]
IRDMAMESSLSAIGIADLNGYLTYANRALADMRGLTDPRDLLGRHVSELWVDPEKIRGVLRTLADQDKFTGELVGRRSDGTEFVAHVTVNFVTGQAGEPVCIMATATDITGKRRMEEALRESEERYRTLVESAPDAIFLLSRDGDILYLSSAGGRLFGVDPETLQGRNIRELFPPDIVEKWLETIQGVADSRTGPVTGETLLPEEYGNTWLETRLIPMMEGEGFVKSVLGISRDITGWKRAEEQLRLQAQVLRQVDDAVIAVDLEGRITYLNLAAERLYGVPSSEAPGKPSTEVFTYEWLHPDDKEEVWLALRDTGIWHGVTIHRKLDGEAIFVDATLSVLEGDHGEVAGVLCSFRDITEQRRAEIELRIKDMAIASSLSSIILVNLDGRIIYANRAFHAMAGWEQEKDVVGTTVSALWADPEEEKQVWEEILRSGAWYGETMNRRRDGTVFPIQLAISTVTDESGRALCLMGSGIDISQRKEAEQDLRIKDMAMESSLSGIVLTDLDGRIIYVNQATLAMNRWEHKEDIIGESISVLWADLEERERVREEVFRSGAWYGEVMNRRRDGTTFPLQLALSTVTDESGRALCLMGSGIDISQQKEIEKDLRVHDMAVASSLTAFTISDLGGRLIYVNQAFLSLWGYDSDTEVLGRSATILWQDEEDAANVIQEIIDSGRYIRERIGRRRDGTKICVRFSGNMVRDDAGAPICLTASIADITDLKRTKEDIRARNRELSILNQIISELTSAVDIDEALKGVLATTISLLDLAGGGIYLVKLDQQSARLVCVQNLPEDFPGHAYIPDITMPPYADVFVDGNAIFTCDREEGDLPPHATIPIVAPGGVIGSLNLIPHGRKEFTGNDRPLLVAIGRGIGRSLERTLLIQQLEKAQREANLYLDILSHDIRNAENISGLYTDLLIDALEGEAKGYAQRIRNSIRKSIEILRNVSTIRRIHHESATLAPIDLDEVIQGEIGIFSEITFHYEGTDLAVMADPLLTEVFTNLIGNAVKFGGAAVEVTIRVEKSGDDVLVSVEDTGPGVPDEMKEVVFMRFRKNMSHKSGQGIGLYITRMLIERYGGRIRVDDRVPGHPEGGAAFRFTLKRA